MVQLNIVLCHKSIPRALGASRLENNVGLLWVNNSSSQKVRSGGVKSEAKSTVLPMDAEHV